QASGAQDVERSGGVRAGDTKREPIRGLRAVVGDLLGADAGAFERGQGLVGRGLVETVKDAGRATAEACEQRETHQPPIPKGHGALITRRSGPLQPASAGTVFVLARDPCAAASAARASDAARSAVRSSGSPAGRAPCATAL